MVKPLFVLLGISLLLFLFYPVFHSGLDTLERFYLSCYEASGWIFSSGHWGKILRKTLVLMAVPWLCIAPIVGLYYLLYRTVLPYLMEIIVLLWLSFAILAMN